MRGVYKGSKRGSVHGHGEIVGEIPPPGSADWPTGVGEKEKKKRRGKEKKGEKGKEKGGKKEKG